MTILSALTVDCEVEPPDAPCPWLWQMAETIRDVAAEGVIDLLPPVASGCDPLLTSFVSMTPPAVAFYDSLSVHLVNFGPTAESVQQKARLSGCGDRLVPRFLASWRVELWLNGYPTITQDGEQVTVPDPEVLQAVNQWVYALGWGAYRALTLAQAGEGGLTFDLPQQIERVTIGAMVPFPPQRGAVGWAIPITTETT